MTTISTLEKRALTIAEFEQELKPTQADLTALADMYRKRMDKETAADVLDRISGHILEENESLTLIDKLLLFVRESYVLGALDASELTADGCALTAVKLLKECEIIYPADREE